MSLPGVVNFPDSLDDPISLAEAKDNASTTLTAGITATSLLIPIADPGEFPNSGFGTLTDSITPWATPPTKIETFRYTSKSGNSLVVPSTADRGLYGTTAQAWVTGNFVEQRHVARYHTVLADALIATQTAFAQFLISLVWGAPEAESGNAIEIAASCRDFAGNVFASGLVDVEIKVSDGANDTEPSATATLAAAGSPVGTMLSGNGSATVVMRTDAGGNLKIRVNETAAASRYLWVKAGGHSRLWVRSSTGVQQLTFS